MGERDVLHAPGRDPQRATGWSILPFAAAVAAGAWAIDHYTGHWLGAWRVIPALALGTYSALCVVLAVLTTSLGASLVLTATHLEVRRPWRRRRWAWQELRDIRVLNLGPAHPHAIATLLVLVPERGPVLPLPARFQAGGSEELEQLATRLGAALHRHHSGAAPLDQAGLEAAAQQGRDLLAARDRRMARGRSLTHLGLALLAGAGLVVSVVRIISAARHGQGWWPPVGSALLCVLVLAQLGWATGRLGSWPERRRRSAAVAFWLLWAAALLLPLKGR